MGMTPPPGASPDSGAANAPAPSPVGASPATPTDSPQMQQGAQLVISIVHNVRALAKMYPKVAPLVAEVNEKMREMLPLIMQSQPSAETQAPPG
jgi:hypothetical protein